MSNIVFARLNIEIVDEVTQASIERLQAALYDKAIWASAEDPEVFYEEESSVIGLSIETSSDHLSLVEAGSVLGQCQVAYEATGIRGKASWISLHKVNGDVIETTYTPNL